jgi:hypothetical protein
MRIKRLLTDSGSKGVNIFMVNESVAAAPAWDRKNNIEEIRLKRSNREHKKRRLKRLKKDRRKFLTKKAKYNV